MKPQEFVHKNLSHYRESEIGERGERGTSRRRMKRDAKKG